MFAWKRQAHLQRLSGVILALILTLFVAVPTLDLMVCQGDEAVASASHDHHAKAGSANSLTDCEHEDGSAPCPHGHVHSASAAAPSTTQVPAPIPTALKVLAVHDEIMLAWITIGQDRPPRA